MLFLHGHASHISLEIINLALEHNITLICLPPHTSLFLQPLDVGVFKSVKAMWRHLLEDYYVTSRFRNVDKINFCEMLSFLVEKAFLSSAVMGFEKNGLYPLNRDKISVVDFNQVGVISG